MAAGDYNGKTYLWDIARRKIIAILPDPRSQGVQATAFGQGGTILAAGDANGRAYVWDIATKRIAATFNEWGSGAGGVTSVAFGREGAILAAGDGNGKTYLWKSASHAS